MARVILLGQLFDGSTSMGRVRALESLGHEVKSIENLPTEHGVVRLGRFLRRRIGVGPVHPVNEQLVRLSETWPADVLWVDKGVYVAREALARFRGLRPHAKLIQYTNDRTGVTGNTSVDLLRALSQFDLIATTIRDEEDLFLRHGARRVFRTFQGYDPQLFSPPLPTTLDASLANRVLFVGAWEAERAKTIASLVDARVPVTVVSPWRQWAQIAAASGDFEWRREAVYGHGYPTLLASSAITICFLRKLSKDEHSNRSFEIPACGGLLLAERTSEHQALFKEDTEAVFFGTDDECVIQCRRLLADPARRRAIARAGKDRCRTSEYSWKGRVRRILAEVGVH